MKRMLLLLTAAIMLLTILCSCQIAGSSSQQRIVSPPSSIMFDESGNGKTENNPSANEYSNNTIDTQNYRNIGKNKGNGLEQVSPPEKDETKILIAYFSRTGNTETVAKHIQTLTGGELFEIKTIKPYPKEYNACLKQASKELAADYRPKLSTHISDMSEYDVIFVGFPIWYGNTPMAIRSFLEEYDLSGKTIIPFCTSGSSGIGQSMSAIQKLCPDSDVLDGLCINKSNLSKAYEQVEDWLNSPEFKDVKESSENDTKKINIKVGKSVFTIILYDNDAANALLKQLPMTLNMSELNGNEKYYYLDKKLPTDSQSVGDIKTGDLMLYGSDCLVLFYKSFSTPYAYTKLGYTENTAGLADALGRGGVKVVFAVEN